jgi:hypothetical protein
VPPAPQHLNAAEKRVWSVLAQQVTALEIYTPSDSSSFESWVRCQALIERALSGEALDYDRGGKAKPASLGAITQLMRTSAMFAAKFRCDPAARNAVPAPAKPASYDPKVRDADDLPALNEPGLGELPPLSS